MPSIIEKPPLDIVKMLLCGKSGSGKTGSLVSLAQAGYNLRILDFDKGLDSLAFFARQAGPKVAERIIYADLSETLTFSGTKVIPKDVQKLSFGRGLRLIKNWKTESEDLGPVEKWTENDVLVLDSLTSLGAACLYFVKGLVGKLEETDWSFYGPAMERQEATLRLLTSSTVPCHVIVISHIIPVEIGGRSFVNAKGQEEHVQGDIENHPSALGNKLPPKVCTYFNTVLHAKVSSRGSRMISTRPAHDVPFIKCPLGPSFPAELPVEVALRDFFKAARGKEPKADA